MALSVPAEVDGVGVYVDVHEVVDYFTLDVVLHPVDQKPTANVDDLNERQVPAGLEQKKTKKKTRWQKISSSRPKKGYLVLLV